MKKSENRTVKLQPKHRQLSWGNRRIVPELRVNGVWLERHGFKAGGLVEITVRENELVIKPLG